MWPSYAARNEIAGGEVGAKESGKASYIYMSLAEAARTPSFPAKGRGDKDPPTNRAREEGNGALCLDFDEALSHRVEDGLGSIVDVELLVHIADVVPDRLIADIEPAGDLRIGLADGDQLQNLDLAPGQAIVELFRRRVTTQHLDHTIHDCAGHHALAGNHGEDAGNDRVDVGVFEHIAARAGT